MQAKKIIKITKIGSMPSVDIEVNSNDHLFYANGIATSNSHSTAFAQHAYLSAYLKAHHPKEFFVEYLANARHRLKPKEEVRRLVQNCRHNKIKVKAPDIRKSTAEFNIIDGEIYAGITDIKGLGKTQYNRLEAYLACNKIPDTFFKYLMEMSDIFKSRNTELIDAGALDFYRLDRKYMVYYWKVWDTLTDREKNIIKESGVKSLLDGLELVYEEVNQKRKLSVQGLINSIKSPTYALKYNLEQIEKTEVDLIGAPLTCTRLDENNLTALATTNIEKYLKGKSTKSFCIAGILCNIKEIKTKKGDPMCFFSLEDSSGLMEDIVCFPQDYIQFKHNIVDDLTVIITGARDYRTGSFIVKEVLEI